MGTEFPKSGSCTLAIEYLMTKQQYTTMIAVTTAMIPSTRSSAPTAIPTSLEHVHGLGASDNIIMLSMLHDVCVCAHNSPAGEGQKAPELVVVGD